MNAALFKDKSEIKKLKSDIHPYTNRHLLKPDISMIPFNDKISIDFIGKKLMYVKWDKSSKRKDEYKLHGLISIVVHTHKSSYKHEVNLESIASLIDDDIPF